MAALLFATFFRVNNMQLIFQYLSIFGIGILTYFYQFKKQVSKPVYIAFCILFLVQIYIYQHLDVFCASAFTLLVLNFWNYNHGVLNFFSNISFSLYLTHTTIGGKVINLGIRFVHSTGERYLLFLTALGASILFAYLFYRVIEKPFIVMGKRLAYKY
jgi:peptidoglycan/LPS O-acetylase OafA/YrhL